MAGQVNRDRRDSVASTQALTFASTRLRTFRNGSYVVPVVLSGASVREAKDSTMLGSTVSFRLGGRGASGSGCGRQRPEPC